MNIYKLNKSKGFTLMELLIAISIISTISIAFFTVVNTTIKTNKKNEVDIKAMQIAQTHIENIRNQLTKEDKLEELTLMYNEKKEVINLRDSSKNEIYINLNHNSIDNNTYIAEILLTRENGSSNKYLYDVKVEVTAELSKKRTILVTSILDR